jgi:L-arabinose isomerase
MGIPQHTELSTAAEIDQHVDFGNLLGVDLLIIDGATNRRDVARPDRVR